MNNYNILFISPHLDDAVYSCSQLIRYMKNNNKILVVSIFTQYNSKSKNVFTNGEKRFASNLEDGAPMMVMPAEKVGKTDKAFKVGTSGSKEVYLKDKNGNVYHCMGGASKIGGWFNHYKDNNTFDLDTDGKDN